MFYMFSMQTQCKFNTKAMKDAHPFGVAYKHTIPPIDVIVCLRRVRTLLACTI
jgi:hypothetical protein